MADEQPKDPNATGGGEQSEGVKNKVPVGGKPDPKPEPEKSPITFPDQASLQARLDRATEAGKKALIKDLGFDSAEALAAATKAQREAAEAAKTQAQKDTEALTKANERAAKGENALKLAKFEIAAHGKGVPADRLAAAGKLADLSKATADLDAGTVTGMDDVITALLAENPFLVTPAQQPPAKPPTGGSGSNPGGGGGTPTLQEQIAKAEADMNAETDPVKRSRLAKILSGLETSKLQSRK